MLSGACGGDTRVTLVSAFEAGDATEGPLEVLILPYDPDALRDSLAAAHGVPEPLFPDLMAWFLAYRTPELTDSGPVALGWLGTRDSVVRLADSLRRADRRSAGYTGAYSRFRALYQRFTQRSSARNGLLRESTVEVRELALRAGRAADSLRQWEAAAWAGFADAAEAALAATGRDTVRVMVLDDTQHTVTLPSGHWWITAQTPVPDNPFLERRWNMAIVTDGLPFRVSLGLRNARTAWRH